MRIADRSTEELRELVERGQLDEREVLEVLRNPYCTPDIARAVAARREWLRSHAVRERLAAFPGMPFALALDLLPTLPWLSLLHVAQTPRTPPQVRRTAERKLLERIARMTLGERIALARLAHRPLLPPLLACGEPDVLEALLDNPRLVENDVVLMIRRLEAGSALFAAIARHRRWGSRAAVRRAIAAAPAAPLPVALSVLVQLPRGDLAALARDHAVPEAVRRAAEAVARRPPGERGAGVLD